MGKFSDAEIFKLVDALIGNVEAVGETNADNNALENLDVLIGVTDMCLNKIARATNASNRPEYSMRKVGMTASRYLEELRHLVESSEWLDGHMQRCRNVTEKWDEIRCSEWEKK